MSKGVFIILIYQNGHFLNSTFVIIMIIYFTLSIMIFIIIMHKITSRFNHNVIKRCLFLVTYKILIVHLFRFHCDVPTHVSVMSQLCMLVLGKGPESVCS